MYDIDPEDQDIDCINKVTKTYGKIFKGISFWLYYLQDKKQEKILQFQDIRFQTLEQQSKGALLYLDSSKLYYINTAASDLKNQSHHYFFSKYLSINVNYFYS